MKDLIEEAKSKSGNLVKDRQFLRIQWLSLQYLVKYYAWYSVLATAFVYAFTMLTSVTAPIVKDVSNLALVGFLLQIIIIVRGTWAVVHFIKLGIKTTRNNLAKLVKSLLYFAVITSCGYFSSEFYEGIQGFADIPVLVGYKCLFWGIVYFLMNYSIRKYWRRIGNNLILKPEVHTITRPITPTYFSQRIEYKEPLEKFIIPLAITKEMKLKEGNWAFVNRNNEIVEEENVVIEANVVTVQLRYSLLPSQDLIYGTN
ncbi:hypothetical protein AAFB76_002518 [Enterococcus faecalis]